MPIPIWLQAVSAVVSAVGAFKSATGGSAEERSSGPAPLTQEQIDLQKQAVVTGGIQLGNLGSQTEFQQSLFGQLQSDIARDTSREQALFGGPNLGGFPNQRELFIQRQQEDLQRFKEDLIARKPGSFGTPQAENPHFQGLFGR